MKPSIGRIVVLNNPGQPSNGTSLMPAIITRVWSDGDPAEAVGANVCVNLTALPDNGMPHPVTSVNLFETEQEAIDSGLNRTAWWPDRSPSRPVNEMRFDADATFEPTRSFSNAGPDGQGDVGSASAIAYGDSAEIG